MGFESVPCPLCGGVERRVVIRAADRLALRPATRRGSSAPVAPRSTRSDDLYTVVRCQRCGLVFTDPRPTAERMDSYYPDVYHGVSRDSRLAALEDRYRRRQHREAVRWLRRRRPGRGLLLDVGCGAGDLLCALRDDGWEVRGIEPGPAGVAAARRRGLPVERGRFDDDAGAAGDAGAPGGHGPARPADAAAESTLPDRRTAGAGPGDRRTYDVIVFSGVLEHLHDPLAALHRARALLAPGGLVAILHLPLFDSPEARAFGTRWLALDLPRHLTHFERATLPRLAGAAGLGVASTEQYSRRHSAATLVSSAAPSLQKHRFYLDEGERTTAGQAARKATWFVAVTAARLPARLAAVAGRGNHCSYFLEPVDR